MAAVILSPQRPALAFCESYQPALMLTHEVWVNAGRYQAGNTAVMMISIRSPSGMRDSTKLRTGP